MGAMVSMARDGEDDGRIMAQSQSITGVRLICSRDGGGGHALSCRAEDCFVVCWRLDRHSALPATARRGHGIGRALVQQAITRLAYAGIEGRTRKEERRGEIYNHCGNIPCLAQQRTYSSTGEDILLTRYIHTLY